MKKLIVDDSNCIGCGACVGIDNKHFDFNDSGLSSVISQDNLDDENLNQAIASCPVSAIRLVSDVECDNDECECGDDCQCDNCECSKKAA